MESIKATYFKTHFGAVLDRVGEQAIRIERRGRSPAVLISESQYRTIKQQAMSGSGEQTAALKRLEALASGRSADFDELAGDIRAAAILKKHGQHH